MLEADNALALRRLEDAKEELSEPPFPPCPTSPILPRHHLALPNLQTEQRDKQLQRLERIRDALVAERAAASDGDEDYKHAPHRGRRDKVAKQSKEQQPKKRRIRPEKMTDEEVNEHVRMRYRAAGIDGY